MPTDQTVHQHVWEMDATDRIVCGCGARYQSTVSDIADDQLNPTPAEVAAAVAAERERCELLVLSLRDKANLEPWGKWAWTQLNRLAAKIRNGGV